MYWIKKNFGCKYKDTSEPTSQVCKKERQEERKAKAGKVRSVCLPFPHSLIWYLCSWLWKGETLPGQEKKANTSDVL